jgi:hypothetical protein
MKDHSTRCISRGSRHASNLPSVTTFVQFGACHLFMSTFSCPLMITLHSIG